MTRDHDWIMARVEEMTARGETTPRPARDPVNQPMIDHWLEAIGETDPRYRKGVAPPAMAQVWTMFGLDPARPADDPLHGTMRVLDEAGYPAVLGTNCDQAYDRLLEVGEQVSVTARLESVVGPKRTAVGEGYFVTTVSTWWVGEGEQRERVATMTFRVLKYRPAPRREEPDPARVIRPLRNRDTDFFWEGTAAGELRIQRCNACGALRHPPGPVCPRCHAMDRTYVVAEGTGRIFSFVTHHAPRLPGKQLPLTLAVVELPEGVRMVGEVKAAPDELAIGDLVRVELERVGDDLTLAQWRPVGQGGTEEAR